MALVRRGYADGPFGQIHYRIAQPGAASGRPPLVCLHQPPKTSRDYEVLMGRLGDTRVVVALDTPGYGNSDAPDAPPAISDYADAVLALVEALQASGDMPADRIDLMGYHTGGVIAACIARRAPETIRRLVFVSLPALDADARRLRLAGIARFPVPREDASNIQEMWALSETLNDARLSPDWRHRALGECLCSGHRLPWGFRAVYLHDCVADLEALDQPALILCPRDDLWDVTHEHVTLLRHGRFQAFPEAGNGFLDLHTDAVVALVTDHLDS